MKRIVSAIALLVASTFVTTGAWAQDHQVRATIPFDFTVNGSAAPAGTYTISAPSEDVVNISSWDQKVHFLTAGNSNWTNRGTKSVLVFHKYGDRYFLSEIRSNNTMMNVYFPTSKAEQNAKTEKHDASIPVTSDVMVALN
jgi:hypothetical protein